MQMIILVCTFRRVIALMLVALALMLMGKAAHAQVVYSDSSPFCSTVPVTCLALGAASQNTRAFISTHGYSVCGENQNSGTWSDGATQGYTGIIYIAWPTCSSMSTFTYKYVQRDANCPGSQSDPANPGVCLSPSAIKNDTHASCNYDEQTGGG